MDLRKGKKRLGGAELQGKVDVRRQWKKRRKQEGCAGMGREGEKSWER